ncbi:MAG: hypothetical protein MR550_00645 [Bacilli bacterium]|nr:hypothetical protein [Bacilli bacterium]
MIYIFIRDLKNLIPIEVKSNDNSTISLNKLIDSNKYKKKKIIEVKTLIFFFTKIINYYIINIDRK